MILGRGWVVGLCLMLGAAPAGAQADHARVAVPMYRPVDAMRGLYQALLLPRARVFHETAAALVPALGGYCHWAVAAGAALPARPDEAAPPDLPAVRAQWLATLAAWETLAALPLGPLIERRSLRQIDFQPPRPELIEKALQRPPASLADLERIGTPAKGLPALEWLLWTRPAKPSTPACAYAQLLATEVAAEARALQQAFEASAGQDWDDTSGNAAFAEFINQWVGAAGRLRWAQIDKPRREAATRGRPGRPAAPAYARQASGQTGASWGRQWQVLRGLAVFEGGDVPRPGAGAVPLETVLRGRGLNALADRWVQQVQRTDAALQGLGPAQAAPALDQAVRALAGTQAMAEGPVASALEVRIGFSDADGD